jgi:hypothetical protein
MARRKAGGLVRGYLERISSKVFDSYQDEIRQLVRKRHGVYALYKKDRLYYAGLAKNLRGRVRQHLRDRHAQKWDSFSLYLIRDVNYLKELESLLVHIAEPKGNIVRGKFVRSENLLGALKQFMEQRDRLQRDEILAGPKRKKRKTRGRAKPKGIRRQRTAVLKGMLPPGTPLKGTYKKQEHGAIIDEQGRINIDGKLFNSPSMAGVFVRNGKAVDGWRFWLYKDKNGDWVKLDELRKK